MTLYAVPGEPADPIAEAPAVDARSDLRVVPACEHDWRLVQVHFSDGASVREWVQRGGTLIGLI